MTNKRIFIMNEFRMGTRQCSTSLAMAILVLIGNLLWSATCHAAPPTTSMDAIEQSLITNEKLSWELAIKHEAASYKAFHAPDFFTLNGTGVVNKALSEASALDPNVRFDQCDLSSFDVHFVADDAALVTYHVKAGGLDHGKTFQLDSYASSLWMKRGGTWVNVFYQATPAKL
jgi:hypothetical protein